jgi:uncharacterized protein YndB with AHSA1/START domain
MVTKELVATSQITVNAPISKVWDAFVNPAIIKQYMFGTTVTADWKVGGEIRWKGEMNGKLYEDNGVILQFNPETQLEYTHFSPLAGKPDIPESYHKVTINLAERENGTFVKLTQDHNPTEQAKEHSQKNWDMMLAKLKEMLES